MNTVYISNIGFLFDENIFVENLYGIGDSRKEYITKCKSAEEKARRLGVWLLLRYALDKNGIPFDEEKIKYQDMGKPYLENNPVFFNLSHSGEYAVCAICDIDVGVDIEKTNADFGIVSKKYPELKSALDWTKKEACGKLTGKGFTDTTNDKFFYQAFDFNGYTLTVCTKEKRDFEIKRIVL